MEADQSLLESLPQEQRQKLARRLRQEQIRRYHEREQLAPPKLRNSGGTKGKTVAFKAKDRLRDATSRNDQVESKRGNLPIHIISYSLGSS